MSFHKQKKVRMNGRLSQRRRKDIGSLVYKKHRERRGEMLVEGYRSVLSALQAGAPVVDVLITEAAGEDERIVRMLSGTSIPVYVVSTDDLRRFSDVETNQGILAVASIVDFPVSMLSNRRTILALDGIQDPGNAGTLIRTAAWFGVDVLLAGAGTVDFYNPKVVRSAMGGLWDVGLVETVDLVATLSDLKKEGFVCYGADLTGTSSRAWQPVFPSVMVLGSEAAGLSADVSALLDERLYIKGGTDKEGVESLNVAIAAGVMVYEWMKPGL